MLLLLRSKESKWNSVRLDFIQRWIPNNRQEDKIFRVNDTARLDSLQTNVGCNHVTDVWKSSEDVGEHEWNGCVVDPH
jgi:hypothetical protein